MQCLQAVRKKELSWSRPVPGEERLVADMLHIARRAARDYAAKSGGRRTEQEAMGDALVALLEAVRKHDPQKGPLERRAVALTRARVLDGVRRDRGVSRRAAERGHLPPLAFSVFGDGFDVVDERGGDADGAAEWEGMLSVVRELLALADRVKRIKAGPFQLKLFRESQVPGWMKERRTPEQRRREMVRKQNPETKSVCARLKKIKAKAAAGRKAK